MRKIKQNKVFKSKIFKWIIAPFILLIFWIGLAVFQESRSSFSVLEYAHYRDTNNDFENIKLSRKNKLSGQFIAKENNLGIIALRFINVKRVDYSKEDLLFFRLKEKQSRKWLFNNQYRSGLFSSDQIFPFGFKKIEGSKGKVYEFEIVSSAPENLSLVEVAGSNPIYFTKYKFQKNEIFKDTNSLVHFFNRKLVSFLTNSYSLLNSLIFLLPLVIYLFWLMSFFNSNSKYYDRKRLFAILAITLIFLDLFLLSFSITGLILGLSGMWVLSIYVGKLNSRVTFYLSVSFIFVSILTVYFGLDFSIDKLSTYAYTFLIIGSIQNLIEFRRKRSPHIR